MTPVFHVSEDGQKPFRNKAMRACGSKFAGWVVATEEEIVVEFDRLLKLELKISNKKFMIITKELIINTNRQRYSRNLISRMEVENIIQMITTYRVQHIMYRYIVVLRKQNQKCQISSEVRESIERIKR